MSTYSQILLHLQKGSSVDLLQHYGDFYASLVGGGYASWQDYLLDQVD
jgi:hypothetical protein